MTWSVGEIGFHSCLAISRPPFVPHAIVVVVGVQKVAVTEILCHRQLFVYSVRRARCPLSHMYSREPWAVGLQQVPCRGCSEMGYLGERTTLLASSLDRREDHPQVHAQL